MTKYFMNPENSRTTLRTTHISQMWYL